MNRNFIIIVMAVSLIIGLFLGNWFSSEGKPTSTNESLEEPKPLFYRNPMDPNITSPAPAQDHMGMDYIPVYADSDNSDPTGTVKIDPVTRQSMGVRTALATHRDIERHISTGGRIGYDETKIIRLHPKTEGWIESLHVQTTGELVKNDDILLSLYSPKLVATQQEYLLALSNQERLSNNVGAEARSAANVMVENAKQRLQLLDVPAHQLDEIRASRAFIKELHIHSPGPGTIIQVGVRKGQHVTPSTELYFIADLSRVWVYVDIFEDELPWVEVGNEAVMKVRGVPGQEFNGRLVFIYPYADRDTRSIKARLEFDNPDLLLKPDMFADITVMAQPVRHVLVVPSEAIIRSGLREVIFVNTAPGRFEPREVTVGIASNGWTHILSGISLNEKVVTSGQFLIDSESKLREAAAKMVGDRLENGLENAAPAMEHQHD